MLIHHPCDLSHDTHDITQTTLHTFSRQGWGRFRMMTYLDHLNETNKYNDNSQNEEEGPSYSPPVAAGLMTTSAATATTPTTTTTTTTTTQTTKSRQPQRTKSNKWTPVVSTKSKKKNDGTDELSSKTPTKSRSARKNERKRQRKKLLQQQQQQHETNPTSTVPNNKEEDQENSDSDNNSVVEDEALARALAESVHVLDNNHNYNDHGGVLDDPRLKRLRNLRKKLASAEQLIQSTSSTTTTCLQRNNLNDEQRQKVERIPLLQSEITVLEHELREEEQRREDHQRQVEYQNQQLHKERTEQWKQFVEGQVIIDGYDTSIQEQFTCPLCAGPLEAAIQTLPCQHVFCRACLEDSLEAASTRSQGDPEALVCPMCRTMLWDMETQKCTVTTASSIRRKMKKLRVKCRCGTQNIALSSLRQHLRHCQEGVPTLFQDDTLKKFKHEFQQPNLNSLKVERYIQKQLCQQQTKKKISSTTTARNNNHGDRPQHLVHHDNNDRLIVPDGYDEEAEIQAAILLSIMND